jgi:serine/threonine protein phosphatase 1
MDLFIIGDVHGCYHTFRKLVETHWKPATMLLIQLGDLVDRGRNVPETVAFARELERTYPEGAMFLKGNHDAELVSYWNEAVATGTVEQFAMDGETLHQYNRRLDERAADMYWLGERPLFWTNDHMFVSHAGVAASWERWEDALNENDNEGILWTRNRLKDIGKVQIIGHTPRMDGQPEYRHEERCWNIDTAAVFGLALTALHLSADGSLLNTFSMPTIRLDTNV